MSTERISAVAEESIVRMAKHKCIEQDVSLSYVIETLLSFWLGRPARNDQEEQIMRDVEETIEMQKRVMRKGE